MLLTVIVIYDRKVKGKSTIFTNWAEIDRGAGATGERGQLPPLPKQLGASRGQQLPYLPELHFEIRALFPGLEFITIFKQRLTSNLCLNFNQL
jgi:hypothetical protein